MSSDKTTNLALHKWAGTDPVERTEFNDNFGIIDNKIWEQSVQKADKAYVNAQISKVNGGPKGAYATLTALQAAFPSGDTNNYVVNADNKWYYWSGTAWTAGTIYQSAALADGSVTPDKTSFFSIGKNIFNPTTVTPNTLINYAGGGTQSNTQHIASDYIAVNPSTTYVVNQDYNLAFYTSAKVFIAEGAFTSTQLKNTPFTTPTNCAFIRVSVKRYDLNPNIANETQIEVGSSSTSFETYGLRIQTSKIPPVGTTGIIDKAITVEKLGITKMGKNLYNKLKATDGFLINGNTDGSAIAWATHSASEFIAIDPNANYIWSVQCNYAFYTSQQAFISGKNSNLAKTPVLSPANAAFVRFSIDTNTTGIKDTCQLEKGSFSTSYAPYGMVIDPVYINLPDPGSNTSFSGYNWNALGDSITAAGTYQGFVQSKLGFATIRNYGIGGTTIADKTGSVTDAMVNRWSSMDDNAHFITVMGGTNDWGQNVVISNPSNAYDKSTLTGAIRTIIEGLIAKYPGKYIVWATLPQRNNVTYPTGINGNGDTTQDYVTAIKNVCKEYAIPCVDIHNESGINRFNMDTNGSLMPDRVHPSDAGHKRLASLFIETFKKIVY